MFFRRPGNSREAGLFALPWISVMAHVAGMASPDDRSRERRWIVSAESGQFSTLGRHSDPSEDEILVAESGLRAAGLSGWLAVAEGGFHVPGTYPRLMEIRRLCDPERSFADAAEAFEVLREGLDSR